MEDQAVSLVMRGGEMMLRMTRETARMAMQAIALIKALLTKLTHTGQTPLKWLTKQYDTAAFAIRRDQLADYRSAAKEIKLTYALAEHSDPAKVTVVVRQADIHNFNHVMDEIGVVENDLEPVADYENAKDEGILSKKDEGKGYYAFTLNSEDGVAFQKLADEKNLMYATPQSIGAPIDYLAKDEMLKESYGALVERNKDNSPESGLVHSTFWPKLAAEENIETVALSEEQYEHFKREVYTGDQNDRIPFAVTAKDSNLILAYRSEDRDRVQDITGKTEHKALVGKNELTDRMAQAAEKGSHNFVILGDQREQARDMMKEAGIAAPEMKQIAKGEKYFENLEHRAERIKNEAKYAAEKQVGSQQGMQEQAGAAMDKTAENILEKSGR
ncbi:MAG TPA: hypothetical protein DEB31_11320 [Clostridiales bacterium]|nr:hypothetical protein [Clostridiales bacterium]